MNDDHVIYVPGWYVRESGLWVPSSALAEARSAPPEVPEELRPDPTPVAIGGHVPTSADYAIGVANEEGLGMTETSRDDLIAMLSQLPFEPSFLAVARFAAEVWQSPSDPARQLELIRTFRIDVLTEACAQFLGREGRNSLLAEQYLTVLQRLLVDHARAATAAEGMTDAEGGFLIRSLFATATYVGSLDEHLMELDIGSDEWLVYLTQNGVYNARQAQLNSFTRARALFVDYHARLTEDIDWCPLDEWFDDDYGLNADEQHAAGFALYGISGGLDDERAPTDRSLITPPFGNEAMAAKRDQITEAFSAEREWYSEQFAAALAESGDENSIAWERRPFLRRPFLRMADGAWLLVTPRAIDSWLGDGFFYRLLTSAQERGLGLQFSRYFGRLVEAYALDLVRSVYPGERPVGGGRVYGEQPYGRGGGLLTSDVAIDLGTDLVLIEVVSARLTNQMQVAGNPELLQANLGRMLFKKMGQVGRVAAAVLDGSAAIPDVDPAHVQRIWPIVVSAGNLMHIEALWAQIEAKLPDELKEARVETLTVLNLEDLEYLCAIIETGEHLPTVLARKAGGPYRELEFTRWAQEELGAPFNLRPKIIEARWDELRDRMVETLGFDPRERERAED